MGLPRCRRSGGVNSQTSDKSRTEEVQKVECAAIGSELLRHLKSNHVRNKLILTPEKASTMPCIPSGKGVKQAYLPAPRAQSPASKPSPLGQKSLEELIAIERKRIEWLQRAKALAHNLYKEMLARCQAEIPPQAATPSACTATAPTVAPRILVPPTMIIPPPSSASTDADRPTPRKIRKEDVEQRWEQHAADGTLTASGIVVGGRFYVHRGPGVEDEISRARSQMAP